ncbi:hypothetical protein WNY51_03305 [Pseudocolwellia sp. AS88]|uniref:hypothetical protein n=1 Tax=Pseudocolwellia sp. AS88 TaxID=3063958 RepID=UPI0031744021
MPIEVIQADYQNEQHTTDLLFLLIDYAMDVMGGGEPLSEYTQKHLIGNLKQQSNVFTVLA